RSNSASACFAAASKSSASEMLSRTSCVCWRTQALSAGRAGSSSSPWAGATASQTDTAMTNSVRIGSSYRRPRVRQRATRYILAMSDAAELSSDPPPEDAGHLPVLPRQVLDLLAPAAGMVCLDCTVGRAGHAKLIAPQLAPGGTYVGLDVDPVNVAYAADQLRAAAPESVTTHVVKSNFAAARQVLDLLGIGKVNLLLADLGFASSQMSDPSRGLSFAADGPLDMRLDPDLRATAADLVNHLPERELADLIYRFGEERHSRRIARI